MIASPGIGCGSSARSSRPALRCRQWRSASLAGLRPVAGTLQERHRDERREAFARPSCSNSSLVLLRPSSASSFSMRCSSICGAGAAVAQCLVQQPAAQLAASPWRRLRRYCGLVRAFAVATKLTHVGLGWALRADDLDGLAVLHRRAQRDQAAVDLGGDAPVADVRVHGIGEVDAGRAARQAQDVALGVNR